MINKQLIVVILLLSSILVCAQAEKKQDSDPETQVIEQGELVEYEEPILSKNTPLPLEQIKIFSEAFVRIKHSYVELVTDETLLDYAIQGMLQGLDPHSAYYKEDDFTKFNEGATGEFSGLGMEVVMEKGLVKVVTPIDDSPAQKAGVLANDLIITIDGTNVLGLNLNEAIDLMRGKAGTDVVLTLLRKDTAEPFNVTITRGIIRTKSVRAKQLNNEIAYIRISQFLKNTAELLREEVENLSKKPEIKGMVLDLRNNPGGLLNNAIAVSDIFLNQGVIVSTKGRQVESNEVFSATPGDLFNGKPIVVLINGGSASASEIVAGALQDNKRALLLGTTSFGKGSVQSVINIREEQAIKLTTARYYTPNGVSIQAAGIEPDILVPPQRVTEVSKNRVHIKEANLAGHLENDNKKQSQKKTNDDVFKNDYQLKEAFNLVTGLTLYQPNQQ